MGAVSVFSVKNSDITDKNPISNAATKCPRYWSSHPYDNSIPDVQKDSAGIILVEEVEDQKLSQTDQRASIFGVWLHARPPVLTEL